MNLFEQAARKKLRFPTTTGQQITAEDLWDLPLQGKRLSLDSIAVDLHKQLNDGSALSFVSDKSTTATDLKLRFDIVKYVIDDKLAQRAAYVESNKRAEMKKQITEALQQKREQALHGKSEEELIKMLDAL